MSGSGFVMKTNSERKTTQHKNWTHHYGVSNEITRALSRIRFIHNVAYEYLGDNFYNLNVDIYLNDKLILENISYGDVGVYIRIYDGVYNIKIKPSTNQKLLNSNINSDITLIDKNVELGYDETTNSYTAIIHGLVRSIVQDIITIENNQLHNIKPIATSFLVSDGLNNRSNLLSNEQNNRSINGNIINIGSRTSSSSSISTNYSSDIDLVVVTDIDVIPPPGKSYMRFIHAAASLPILDLRAANDQLLLYNDVEYLSIGEYITIESGTTDIDLYESGYVGISDRKLVSFNQLFENQRIYTFISSGINGPVMVDTKGTLNPNDDTTLLIKSSSPNMIVARDDHMSFIID